MLNNWSFLKPTNFAKEDGWDPDAHAPLVFENWQRLNFLSTADDLIFKIVANNNKSSPVDDNIIYIVGL